MHSVRELQRRAILKEIKELPWWDKDKLYNRFVYLDEACKLVKLDFWELVEEIGGFFAMRILIHTILVVKGIPGGTRKVGPAPDQVQAA